MSGGSGARHRLVIDFIGCDGQGICADFLPERIRLDEWGFPIVTDESIPDDLLRAARRTARACPELAMRIEEAKAKHR